MHNKNISVVIPVYNEEAGIPALVDAISKLEKNLRDLGCTLEALFVDNNSVDGTWDSLYRIGDLDLRFKLRCVRHSRNEGMQRSLLTGLSISQGDAIVVLQADLQDPIEVIPQMVAEWLRGASYVATVVKRRKGDLRTRISAWMFYRALKFASANKVILDSSDFYLVDGTLAKQLVRSGGSNPFIRTALSAIQEPDVILNYERSERNSGKSNYNWSRKLTFALDGLLNDIGGLVNKLIVFSTSLALLAILMGLTLATSIIIGWRSPVAGWLSTFVLLLVILVVITSVGSISLALMSRIYKDTKINSLPEISEDWHSK